MLFMPSLLLSGRHRPGRADKTVTRHVSQAGSYEVTTAQTGRPGDHDGAKGPSRQVRGTAPEGPASWKVRPGPERRQASSLSRGHLIAGPSGPAPRIGVHAVNPAVSA